MNSRTLFSFLLLLAISVFVFSCVDEDFDEPPADGTDPMVGATHTIAQLMEMYPPSLFQEITEDIIISGVVIADDESGNFYQSLVIQDETAGILIRVNASELFNEYRIGRRVFVKCNGLAMGNYNNLPQLGGALEDADGNGAPDGVLTIPEPLLGDYILKGQWNQFVEPAVKKVSELTNADANTLIRLENVQFADSELGMTYAIDSVTQSGIEVRENVNRTLFSCDGEPSIIVRTSGFASFANQPVAEGSGSIVAVYSIFGTDKQLILRDISDVSGMNQPRCDLQYNLRTIRSLWTGTEQNLPDGIVLEVEVISDRANGNINSQNIVIQDNSGSGIVVRFQSQHSFDLGDVLTLDMSGAELSEFNSLLQINNLDNLRASVSGGSIGITPKELTVAEINENIDLYESTLVEIKGATISGQATYAGTTTVTDGTGEIPLFTFNNASFSGDAVPGGSVDVVAIVSRFNTPQINIRNRNDITGSGSGGDEELVDISEIRAQYEGSATTVQGELKIEGVVISDYANENTTGRNAVVQDASGGIVIRFTDFHSFEQGDEIEVIVTGVELSEFNGLLQLNEVPLTNATNLGFAGDPAPVVKTVAEILADLEQLESTLVTIEDATISGSGTYSGSLTVDDGTGTISLFTRSQATFASSAVPTEAVDITAIVSEFDEPQVNIRNLDDVDGGGMTGDPELVSVSAIRDLWSGSTSTITENYKVKGVVITDVESGNTTFRNLVIQDGDAGITVRFVDPHSYALGEEVEIVVAGQELSEYNGLLQVNDVSNANVTSLGTGTLPTPRQATISEIIANGEEWESTLVEIMDVEITGSTTFNGNTTVTDATGSIPMFTRSLADFADDPLPSGPVSMTAVVSEFNEYQVFIRNSSDIQP